VLPAVADSAAATAAAAAAPAQAYGQHPLCDSSLPVKDMQMYIFLVWLSGTACVA
jgi:hypothetical protein